MKKSMPKTLWLMICVTATCFLVLITLGLAEEKDWIGGSGWWDSDSNWSPPGQPQNGESANLIQSGPDDIVVDYRNDLYPDAALGDLNINATETGTMTLRMLEDYPILFKRVASILSMMEQVILSNGGTNTVTGKLHLGYEVSGSGTYNLNNGTLSTNYEYIGRTGTGTINQSSGWNIVASDFVVDYWNPGEYSLSNGNLETSNEYIGLTGAGTVTQTDGIHSVTNQLSIGTGSANGSYNHDGGTLATDTFLVGGSGEMFLNGGSVKADILDIANALTFDLTGGELEVFNVKGNLTNTGGTLAPGASPGLLTIEGDYTQLENAILEIELGGLLRGDEYDAVDVTGTLSLDGTLEVIWWDGFTALLGDTFDILDWGARIGAFDIINLPDLNPSLFWDTSTLYVDGTLSVSAEVVPEPNPEPTTMLLLGSGLIGLAGFRRRFRKK